MRISFGDLKIGNTARKYLERAIDKNWISEGDNVREFEKKFAAKFGYKHAIATSSGIQFPAAMSGSIHSMQATVGLRGSS